MWEDNWIKEQIRNNCGRFPYQCVASGKRYQQDLLFILTFNFIYPLTAVGDIHLNVIYAPPSLTAVDSFDIQNHFNYPNYFHEPSFTKFHP